MAKILLQCGVKCHLNLSQTLPTFLTFRRNRMQVAKFNSTSLNALRLAVGARRNSDRSSVRVKLGDICSYESFKFKDDQ